MLVLSWPFQSLKAPLNINCNCIEKAHPSNLLILCCTKENKSNRFEAAQNDDGILEFRILELFFYDKQLQGKNQYSTWKLFVIVTLTSIHKQ